MAGPGRPEATASAPITITLVIITSAAPAPSPTATHAASTAAPTAAAGTCVPSARASAAHPKNASSAAMGAGPRVAAGGRNQIVPTTTGSSTSADKPRVTVVPPSPSPVFYLLPSPFSLLPSDSGASAPRHRRLRDATVA